jgi:hypothetical protein
MARDNFSRRTINLLAERVGFLCSNPACGCHTVGPNQQEDKSTRIGKAAHITAAAPGGPRFELAISAPQRSGIGNGIWLCSNCADLIDKDEKAYSASLLGVWKVNAEHKMAQSIKAVYDINTNDPLQGPYLEADLIYRQSMRVPNGYSDKNSGQMENGIYVVEIGNQPIIHWTLGWELSLVIHNNSSYPAFNVSVEIDAGGIQTIESNRLPKVNHVKAFDQVKFKINYMENLESSHTEADEKLSSRIPAAFDKVVFKIYYFDEARKRHRTLAVVSGQQISNEKA